jgi:hypothetical protein
LQFIAGVAQIFDCCPLRGEKMKKFWNMLNVIATGLIVLVMVSLLLFLGRSICREYLMQSMPNQYKAVAISPSGVVPGEGTPMRQNPLAKPDENVGFLIDPNIKLSSIQANIEDSVFKVETIGIFRIFMNAIMQRHCRDEKGIYYDFVSKNNFLLFNEHTGLFERKMESSTKTPEGEKITEVSELFAGPNGISEKESPSLGRFEDPIVSEVCSARKVQIYDRNKRRFFTVDFYERKVIEGLELAKGDIKEPIAMGWIVKGVYSDMGMVWNRPEIKDVNGHWIAQDLLLSDNSEPNDGMKYGAFCDPSQRYLIVLARNDRIYNLDTVKWSLQEAGFLPIPASLFSDVLPKGIALPKDLLAYQVIPAYSYLRIPKQDRKSWDTKDVKYLGLFVGVLSREGTSLAVAVFDPDGRQIYRSETNCMTSSGPMPTCAGVLLLLENLQPPVLEAASFLCANCFEASEGHRSIFILPNSFVGMLGRGTFENFFEQIVKYFLLTGLSLILSVWLAFRIRKDAVLIGLSGAAKKWWFIGTIAFGLPAYITYRMTRPKETLVSCQNCGKMRRPDMETCHHCGSKWEVPELTPPNWRIKN